MYLLLHLLSVHFHLFTVFDRHSLSLVLAKRFAGKSLSEMTFLGRVGR